jgi:hypothetical protein
MSASDISTTVYLTVSLTGMQASHEAEEHDAAVLAGMSDCSVSDAYELASLHPMPKLRRGMLCHFVVPPVHCTITIVHTHRNSHLTLSVKFRCDRQLRHSAARF